MGYISIKKALIQSQLAKVQAALAALYDIQLEASSSNIQSYAFDSGEGSQRTTRKDLSKLLDDISRLEATQDHLLNALYNMGIISIRLRRKKPSGVRGAY